jgi:hypothetical protein
MELLTKQTMFTVTTMILYTITLIWWKRLYCNSITSSKSLPQLTECYVLNKDITCNPAPQTHKLLITNRWSWSVYYTASPAGSFYLRVCLQQYANNYTFTVTDAAGCTYATTAAIL